MLCFCLSDDDQSHRSLHLHTSLGLQLMEDLILPTVLSILSHSCSPLDSHLPQFNQITLPFDFLVSDLTWNIFISSLSFGFPCILPIYVRARDTDTPS